MISAVWLLVTTASNPTGTPSSTVRRAELADIDAAEVARIGHEHEVLRRGGEQVPQSRHAHRLRVIAAERISRTGAQVPLMFQANVWSAAVL